MIGDIIQAPQSCRARFCFSTKSRLSVRVSHDCGKREKQQVGGFLIRGKMKICTKCHIEKPLSEFYKKDKKHLKSYCKSCAHTADRGRAKRHYFWAKERRHQHKEPKKIVVKKPKKIIFPRVKKERQDSIAVPSGVMKLCTKCRLEKDESEFHVVTRDSNELRDWCKKCTRADNAKRNQRKHYHRKKNFYWTRELRHQKKVKPHYTPAEAHRNYALRVRYGITLQEYRELLEKQNGVCAICGRGPGKRSLHVDHCHKTGKVRALLCNGCNTTLGKVGDDTTVLEGLIRYLKTHQTPPTPLNMVIQS